MQVIITAIALAILVAASVGYVLFSREKPIYEATSMPSVRIGDPGENLVGPDWSGLYKTSKEQSRERQAASNPD